MHAPTQLDLSVAHSYDPTTKKLTIRNQSSFPTEILNFAEHIEILDLSHGHLTELPDNFDRLTRLRVLFMSHNNFTEVPEVLAACAQLQTLGMVSCMISRVTVLPPNLEALILTNNYIGELPASIGTLKALKKLTITGNRLRSLPQELLECHNLELIRLAVNQFDTLPDWLLRLPSLAWFADAGNPGSPTPHSVHSTIKWSNIRLGDELGASSKNTVYAATIASTGQEVAVKVFGGMVSADGSPNDEIAACLSLPTHPAVVQTVGEISNAPDNNKRLIMARIPQEYVSLGLPPTLQTVTRDTYSPETTFDQSFIMSVLCDIAGALQHMHRHHLMHGDIYAHNILVNTAGRAILADLGAASFYTPASDNRHELVEVRAFGQLMSELLARRSAHMGDASNWTFLEALAAKCLLESFANRPTFAEISLALQALR